MVSENKAGKLVLPILALFGLIYCSISLVNHYNFRTYALDLGLYNNALFDYAHFRVNQYSLLKHLFPNPLCDHFALITPLVSPLYWIFGSYTMLLIQIFSILFGAYGVYKYFSEKSENNYFPLLAMIHFLSIWGIYSALSFDFHDNVVAAMLVPWFFYFFEKKRFLASSVFFVMILISKENMALWAASIGLGLALMYRKDRRLLKISLLHSAFAVVYFIVVIKVIMPFISGDFVQDGYYHFKYHALGDNGAEAIKTMFTRPLYTIKLLFVNHLNDPMTDNIKKELHLMVLLSGGIALLFRPWYLVMLLPIFAQKLFSDDYAKWGINYQYSIEFVPILTFALFNWLHSFSNKKLVLLVSFAFVSLSIYATYSKLEERDSLWYVPELSKFYEKAHYRSSYDTKELYKALKSIPDEASVSASSPLVPHLSFRKAIYQYPDMYDSEYIVLLTRDACYPLSQEDLEKKISEFNVSKEWTLLYDQNYTVIFKKK